MKITNTRLNKAYETDASEIKGNSTEIIIPTTITELQLSVIKYPKITIRGAGTGLVGGSVPQNDIVIDLSKFNKIGEFNRIRRTIEVEAGVVLDDLNEFLEGYDLEFPVQPSSHSVCTLGGMIATNAVGSRAVKYGRTYNWIEWLDIVNSSGRIERKFKAELTDYSGMEGISGIIIKACLKLEDKKQRTAELIELDNISAMIEKVKELKRNQYVSMIEFYDKSISKILGLKEDYYLLVEYESEEGSINKEEYKQLMRIRDNLYPTIARSGNHILEDPKLFLDKIPEIMDWFENNKIPVFGHISTGILHACFSEYNKDKIKDMMKIVKRLSGQITGEHGIGLVKKQFVEEQDKNLIRLVKKRTDPTNKFNQNKVIE